jgi:hypothetical protein
VSLVLGVWAGGLDLGELLKLRQVVVNTGNLLNQSLRTSWGRTVDAQAGQFAKYPVMLWQGRGMAQVVPPRGDFRSPDRPACPSPE